MGDMINRLARLDTCAVSDALDKLGIPNQVASGLEQRSATRRVSGRVVTFRLVPAQGSPAQAGPVRHLGTSAIELAQAGEVIVVEQRTGVDAGCWGGILTLGAKVRGVAGVIADGPVRDIEEARTYDFPIFCRSLTARTARGRVVEAEVNQPVSIGEVTVRPGDYVVADAGGCAFVPAARIEEVLATAEMISAREAAMAKALLAGRPISEVMGADYEHMLH